MFSGFGLIYYSTVYHPNQLHVQATATVQTRQTEVAQTTVTANAQATGTAVAIANATATAQAQATAAAVATATALQNIYNSATQGSPVLNDSLSFNTGSRLGIWPQRANLAGRPGPGRRGLRFYRGCISRQH